MASASSSPARNLVALVVVILTVIAVWTFVDYRNQPPPPPPPVAAPY
jgi:hypothetical protein